MQRGVVDSSAQQRPGFAREHIPVSRRSKLLPELTQRVFDRLQLRDLPAGQPGQQAAGHAQSAYGNAQLVQVFTVVAGSRGLCQKSHFVGLPLSQAVFNGQPRHRGRVGIGWQDDLCRLDGRLQGRIASQGITTLGFAAAV